VTISGVSGALNHSTTIQLTVNASGGGPVVKLLPISFKWGKVTVGTTAPQKTSTLTNTGTATLNIGTISIAGADPGDFALVTNAKTCKNGGTVAVGATCKIVANFKPTAKGLRTANVSITDNASNSPQSLPMSGTGQ